MIAVSACLLGENCKYNGKNNLKEELLSLKNVVTICPEVLGGLGIPRKPCEIKGDKIMSEDGEDFSRQYYLGAKKALEICLKNKVDLVILKSNSPSCGSHKIYDGSFSGKLTDGLGIFARMLKEHNIEFIDEGEYLNEYL